MIFDPLRVIDVFHRHGVHYLLVGGLAGRALGSATITNDIDVCYERTDENLDRLVAALRELGARLRGADEDAPLPLDARTVRNGDCFTFLTDAGSLDLRGTPAGTTGFEDLMRGAVRMDFDGKDVFVVGIDDLIRMKRAAGRNKDLVEVANLLALRKKLMERGEL